MSGFRHEGDTLVTLVADEIFALYSPQPPTIERREEVLSKYFGIDTVRKQAANDRVSRMLIDKALKASKE